MTDQPIESIELPDELSEQDRAELEALYGEQPKAEYHPILQIWRDTMVPESIDANKGITVQWAVQICGAYPQMTYALMPAFHDLYFLYIETMAEMVRAEIATDEDCLKALDAAEDTALNHDHYCNLLRDWQLFLQDQEMDWDPSEVTAPAVVAALGEVQKFFFSDRGLTAHLEAIQFDFSDEDQAELRAALDAQREEAK